VTEINGMDHINEQEVREWDLRSKRFGATLRSVLFKGLPDVVNEHLHNWHEKLVLGWIEEKQDLKILDVGCGYGRLSIPIINKFPGVDITGLDISENYVRLYKENTHHPAFVGALENIPAELGNFDYILCVTVLMYLSSEKLSQAVSNLLFHLKPSGKLILIEPHSSGISFQTGFGIWACVRNRIQQDSIRTKGRSFKMKEIADLFSNAAGKIISECRLPITSLFFLPVALIGKYSPEAIARKIFRTIFFLDTLLGGLKLPSIYVAYLITRNRIKA
jgi:2-polyprenyl-3-methyl-5-hydroxy-6-metoxy-1,4-benzoquinol methylase